MRFPLSFFRLDLVLPLLLRQVLPLPAGPLLFPAPPSVSVIWEKLQAAGAWGQCQPQEHLPSPLTRADGVDGAGGQVRRALSR